MKESPVLVVVERVVNLLIPYYAAIGALAVIQYRTHTEQEGGHHTEISTSLTQKVFPTRSSASTAAP